MTDLRGLRALVTGASSGIGAAIARELAAHGANLVITARRKDALAELATELRGKGVEVLIISGDLGWPGAAGRLWTEATVDGTIEIVVNNAGFGAFRPFVDIDATREAEMLQLNITALVELSRRFVEARRDATSR